MLSSEQIKTFQKEIYSYYHTHPRPLPWRYSDNPYHIFVSEMMLQQTQAERAAAKYEQFIAEFPDFRTLASTPLRLVLELWQGLGYNRRALYLQQSAQRVVQEFGGALPPDPEVLESFSGIGHATAREIAAFAFRLPVVFIETNIRRVYIHCFFRDREDIRDREILPLVEATLDRSDPRTWYYALMDYGVMLKRKMPNPNVRSAHYQKQSPFHGSNRQLRGKILRTVTGHPGVSAEEIAESVHAETEKVTMNLEKMAQEGFIREEQGRYFIR